ncbi:MAG: hypothetical protein WDA18_02640 [Candidatus Ratteibacteria bacterium]
MVIDLSDYRNLSITISPLLSTKVQETIITKKANNQFHQEPSFLLSYPFFTRESSFTIKAVDGIDTDMIKISRYQTNPLFEEKKQAKVW